MSATTVYLDHKVITLPIDKPVILARVRASALAKGFEEKQEFHVTLIPSKYGAKLDDSQFQICASMLEDVSADDIVEAGKVFYLQNPKVVDGIAYPRESLIEPITSSQLTALLAEVAVAMGVPIEPYFHVTLFTKGDNKYARTGIGIENPQEFHEIMVEEFQASLPPL